MMALLALPPPSDRRDDSNWVDRPYVWFEPAEPATPSRWERSDWLTRLQIWWLFQRSPWLRKIWLGPHSGYTASAGYGGDPEMFAWYHRLKPDPPRIVRGAKPRSMSAAAAKAYGYK